jgi:hypothetical protein
MKKDFKKRKRVKLPFSQVENDRHSKMYFEIGIQKCALR